MWKGSIKKSTYKDCEGSLLLQYLQSYFGLSSFLAFVQCWEWTTLGDARTFPSWSYFHYISLKMPLHFLKEMCFHKLLTAYFLCQLLVPFPYTLILCLGLGLFLCSDKKKKCLLIIGEYNEVVVAFSSDHSNAVKRMTFSKWNKIFFWWAFMMTHNHWMYHVHNLNVSEQLFLHSSYNTQNMYKAFLICTYKILRHINRNHGLSCLLQRMSFSIYCAHPNSPVLSNYVKSCCCWHKKLDLGTSWKLHVLLWLALKCEAYLHGKVMNP